MGILSKKLSRRSPAVQRVEKFTFQWGNFVDVLISKFQDELNRISKIIVHGNRNKTKSKALFIMNSLHWGAERRNIAQYLRGIQHLADILNKTKKEDPEVQLLFLSGVALPNRFTNTKINGYLLRALNQVASHIMRRKGIETIDMNTVLHSVNNYDVQWAHYLTINPPTGNMRGQFGPGAADFLINTICSGNKI